MSPSEIQRKLAAILSADVKGYSRLMGDDEVATVRTLTAYRGIITELVEAHHGRVVDSPGDNLLAEFASAVDAVECSALIQVRLREENAALPDNRQMEFRIGINVGDVIVDGERIYGDGVNIAARLEGLAEGGGVCISGTVFDQIETKLDYGYLKMGPQRVKNISRPIRSYRLLLGQEEASGPDPRSGQGRTALQESAETDLSGADRRLAPDYHGGFREGLEILKRKFHESVAPSAQNLPQRVRETIEEVFEGEGASPEELIREAREASARLTRESNQEAQRLFRRALRQAPEPAGPRVALGWTYLMEWLWGWSRSPGVLDKAAECARQALGQEPGLVKARLLSGWAHLWRKEYVPALAAGTKVLDLEPANADGAAFAALAMTATGLAPKTGGLLETAVRYEPEDRLLHSFSLGLVFFYLKRYREAHSHLAEALKISPEFPGARLIRGLVYIEQGHKARAREEIKKVLRLTPGFSLKLVRSRYPFRDPADLKRCLTGLRKAGLK